MKLKKIKELTITEIVMRTIALIFALLLSFLSYKFWPNNSEGKISNENNQINANANDSSIQKIFKTEQYNSNNGDVINEFISGDKNIIQKDTIIQKNKPVNPTSTHIDKIENSGNLSIGQSGGVVNQTTIVNEKPKIPSPRHLTEKDADEIIKTISVTYSVEINNPMLDHPDTYPDSNKESFEFANEIINFLYMSGYNKLSRSQYGMIIPDLNKSFDIEVKHAEKTARITVYRQKIKLY